MSACTCVHPVHTLTHSCSLAAMRIHIHNLTHCNTYTTSQLGYDDGMEGRNTDARDAPMLQAPMLQNGDVQVPHDGDAGNAAFDYVMHTSVSPVLQPMPADAEAANGEVRGKGVGGRRLEDLEV